jgi:uncharacterized protein with HEPN domain
MSQPSTNRDLASVLDILEAPDFIANSIKGMTFEQFLGNLEKQYAVQHQLMVIGEAAKRLSEEFRQRQNQIPWTEIAGMRDVLIHRYDDVELPIVWEAATSRLPRIVPLLRPFVGPPTK